MGNLTKIIIFIDFGQTTLEINSMFPSGYTNQQLLKWSFVIFILRPKLIAVGVYSLLEVPPGSMLTRTYNSY